MRSAQFVSVNLLTLALYGATNVLFFVTPLFLQRVRHVSAFGSAAIMVPIEFMLVIGSPLMIRVASRTGQWPRCDRPTRWCGRMRGSGRI